ncbi:hypothetical protein WA026_009734 [Henosepilachna vigintioctopunctata]|uniref:Uncharacterized protein n=1 Tax=Henosepilachna vigintioctopunctata TaxID=420089 RepID=A0AAW1TL72_9CUCU
MFEEKKQCTDCRLFDFMTKNTLRQSTHSLFRTFQIEKGRQKAAEVYAFFISFITGFIAVIERSSLGYIKGTMKRDVACIEIYGTFTVSDLLHSIEARLFMVDNPRILIHR